MSKTEANILIIGGMGHWSTKHYRPLLINKSICNKLFICDIKDQKETNQEYTYFKLNNNFNDNIKNIRKIVLNNNIKVIIISTPPIYHSKYLKKLIDLNVNFICDKPLIAIEGQGLNTRNAILIWKEYNEILKLKMKNNVKIYTPLRRRVQNYYTNMYNNITLIKEKFNQNITFVSIYENDGVYRWDNEMLINFAHGYKEGLGKLTQTGYHMLDIVSKIISCGCKNIKNIKCKVLDVTTVKDNSKNKSVINLKKLLNNYSKNIKHDEIVNSAELDFSVCFTISFYDDIDSKIYLHLRHGGVTNRTIKQYDNIVTGDEGRTDDSQFVIEQGPFQNIYSLVFANDTISDEKQSLTFIKRNSTICKKLNISSEEIKVLNPNEEIFTEEIMLGILSAAMGNKEKQKEFYELEYENQQLTMELYIASLLAKIENKEIEWKIGDLL